MGNTMMQEIHSHQYDEDWKLIYPQEVRVGELMRSPTTVPNYFISFRRAPDGGDTIRFEHAEPGKIILERPPWMK